MRRTQSIALVNPRSLHAWECLGLGYLASYSYLFGFAPEQYRFFSGEFDTDDVIVAGCCDVDVVGFSVTTFQVPHALRLIERIRQVNPAVCVVWGGYGVNGLDANTLVQEFGHAVDHFIQGPGEEAWVDFLTAPQAERVVRRGLIADLNRVPYPDRRLIRIDRNLDKLARRGEGRKTSMELQRGGCPFACVFCAAQSYTQVHGRTRTAENMVGEMVELRDQWGMDRESIVLLSDAEVFLTAQMLDVARLKIEAGVEFGFGMNVVASDVARPKARRVLEELCRAGLREVWMGVEAGPSLMELTRKPITPDQVREAMRVTRELGLVRKAYFILGFTPLETRETVLERADFIDEIDPDVVGFSLYIPVPGSAGYDHAAHRSIDYENSCEYYNKYVSSDALSNEELRGLQEQLVQRYATKATYRQQANETNSMVSLKEKAGRSGY
jgi:radical SAM superfamily enzyme YgiQ (UPF0313 family)